MTSKHRPSVRRFDVAATPLRALLSCALAACACRGEAPASTPTTAATAARSPTPERPLQRPESCTTLVELRPIPELAPATRCAPAAQPSGQAPSDAIGRELRALAATTGPDFVARRGRLVARGKAALQRLRDLSRSAPSARERGLAEALVTRIERPGDAQRLDDFPPPSTAPLKRNPFPDARRAMVAAFSPYPALAFEALARAHSLDDASPPHHGLTRIARSPLFDIVGQGPEGFARLAELAPRLPVAFAKMADLDAERGTCAALAWLGGRLPERSDENGAMVFETLSGTDPLVLHLQRRALRDGPPHLKPIAARALGKAKDVPSVPDLIAYLGDKSLSGAARAGLLELLGAAETERKLAALARECRAEHRRGAAMALRASPPGVGAELLAALAGDVDAAVRSEALGALAWLAITSRDANDGFSDSVERAVLAGTVDAEGNVRRQALDALWRLVVEKKRPLTDAMRSAWAHALADPDRRARSIALVQLSDFFPGDWQLVLVVLGDLGRVPNEWPHRDALAAARQVVGTPTRERVSSLGRSSVPEIRALTDAWLAK